MITVDVLYSVMGVGTEILLSTESGDLLVDACDGLTRDLLQRRYDFYRLNGILLTHEDFDHISGLYALLSFLRNYYRHRGVRSEELTIVVPSPVHQVHLMIQQPLMYIDPGYPIRVHETSPRGNLSIDRFTIRPFAVDHQKRGRVGGAIGGHVGYSVTDKKGFRVVLSGDTRPCETLEQEAKGADVAVIEASARDQDWEKADEQGHMTKSQAERIGKLAKQAIYIHQRPDWFV